MTRFYSLFLTVDPFNLSKDPGLLPKYMGRCGYEAHVVSYVDTTKEREFLPQGVIFDSLGKKSFPDDSMLKIFCWDVFKFIWKNRKQIDILNVYFLKFSILYGLFYKIIHRRGILYVKMDADMMHLLKDENKFFARFRDFIYRIYLSFAVDFVSIESSKGFDYVKKRYSIASNKILFIPDGIDDDIVIDIPVLPYSKKENSITYVGRIGTFQKNTEFFLEACKLIKWKDNWKVYLIGPILPEFDEWLDDFFSKTGLSDRIIKKGPIYDKSLLMDYFNKSKIHCLSSRYESFGIVLAEAQYFGNQLIITPISTDVDFVPSENFGAIVDSPEKMAQKIQTIIDDESFASDNCDIIFNHGKKYLWSNICRELSTSFAISNGR